MLLFGELLAIGYVVQCMYLNLEQHFDIDTYS